MKTSNHSVLYLKKLNYIQLRNTTLVDSQQIVGVQINMNINWKNYYILWRKNLDKFILSFQWYKTVFHLINLFIVVK